MPNPSIFIENLKDLVAGKLRLRWSELDHQTRYKLGPVNYSSLFNNVDLSKTQRTEVGNLERSILTFQSTGNDEADKNTLIQYIANAMDRVEGIRQKKKAGEKSDTIKCFERIQSSIDKFYQQLTEIPFNLLNLEKQGTPDFIFYYYACHYLGAGKFHRGGDGSVRGQKEAILFKWLDHVKTSIHSEQTKEEQIRVVQLSLQALLAENAQIVEPTKGVDAPISVSGVSVLSVPVKITTSTTGTLEELITKALEDINKLSEQPLNTKKKAAAGEPNRLIGNTIPAGHEKKKVSSPILEQQDEEDDDEEQEDEVVRTRSVSLSH